MTKDFTEIDCAIMTRIAGGFTRFYEIWPQFKDMRLVDRRLQALRKKGLLGCSGQRWYLAGSLCTPSTEKAP